MTMGRGKRKTAIDLFCGCGGMSWGLEQSGYEILLGIDENQKYIKSYEVNFGREKAKVADLSKLSSEEIMGWAKVKRGELSILVGGPPCQGFSKNTPRTKRVVDSKNNILVHTFLGHCEKIFPKHIIIENVAEMRKGFDATYTKSIEENLMELGYSVVHHVCNGVDYGLPQRRRRAFFIASRKKKSLTFAPPTHVKNGDDGLFPRPKFTTVWDAIGDLPPLTHGEGIEDCSYVCPPQNKYQLMMRNGRETVKNHVSRKLAPTQYARLSSLQPGQGHADLPSHLQVRGGYSGVYGRLTKEMSAPTITRWVFHPGSGRWGHPVDIRTLSLREIARVQGFSDDFVFEGSYNDICGQLGNAVPPIMMEVVLKALM